MTLSKRIWAVLLLGAGLAAAPLVRAEGYVGVNLGQSDWHASAGDLDAALASAGITAVSSVDDTDFAYKLFAGYRFNPNFALEGGYVDLGSLRFVSNVLAPPPGGVVSGDIKTDYGLYVDAVGMVPVGERFALFGRVGVYRIRAVLDAAGPAGLVHSSGENSDLHFGFGGDFALYSNIVLRVEWERFRNVGTSSTGQGDIDLASGALIYRF